MTPAVRRIHVQQDAGGSIEVVEEADGKLRSLQFGSPARQSTMFTARPHELALEYTRLMAAGGLLFSGNTPQRVLILGLGGGSLPKFFLHHFAHTQVDAVELRPAIIDVAHRFFRLPAAHDRLQLVQREGLAFLLDAPEATYDLIFVDLHDADGMAPVVDAEAFVPACRRVLVAGGVAVYNLWFGVRPAQEVWLRQRLEQVFNPLLDLPVARKRNCIAYGLTMPTPGPAVLAERATAGKSWSLPLTSVLDDLRQRHANQFAS